MNRYLTRLISGLSCVLAAEVILQLMVARSGTGSSHDIASFGGVACGLVAWTATAWSQRHRVRRGLPERPLVSMAVGWAAALLCVLLVLVIGYTVLVIALANGAPLVPGGW